eukprot:TRINITY_DN14044_c0_g1_i1.p1 TRINITY_DN14044_c0_g1~~TRINITY_DN14044_c0_g1_i1.p1  ORF type:complete len:151 (-),score=55.52 TRINITY_DN14044_c0_g1_i1:78-530(-)
MSEIQQITPCPSSLTVHPIRLNPGVELKSTLMKYVADNKLVAPFIMTCCGSLTKATLRLASHTPADGNNKIKTYDEHFEICSLVGTLSGEGGHLHIVLGKDDGSTISGHVVGDMVVFTTAEIVIGECKDAVFTRPFDQKTGFDELKVEKR